MTKYNMQSLNELIAESVEKKDLKTLESLETDISQVLEFTRTRVVHIQFYKQAVINRLLIQNAILKVYETNKD